MSAFSWMCSWVCPHKSGCAEVFCQHIIGYAAGFWPHMPGCAAGFCQPKTGSPHVSG